MRDSAPLAGALSIPAAAVAAARETGDAVVDCTALSAIAAAASEIGRRPAAALEAALAGVAERTHGGSRAMVLLTVGQLVVALSRLRNLWLAGGTGGLVLAVVERSGAAVDCGSPDPRYLARLAGLPLIEPADPAEAWRMTSIAGELSREFCCPVLLRLPENCHRAAAARPASDGAPPAGDEPLALPAGSSETNPLRSARLRELANFSNETALNTLIRGPDRRLGFVASGPVSLIVREAFPRSSMVRMGLSNPLPMKHLRGLAEMCGRVVVVEAGAAIIEAELRAEGVSAEGRAWLPDGPPCSADWLRRALADRWP